MSDSTKNGRMDVFTIVERPNQEKGVWVKIGAAFKNKDDSLNVYLDASPMNGKLHLRTPSPRKDSS